VIKTVTVTTMAKTNVKMLGAFRAMIACLLRAAGAEPKRSGLVLRQQVCVRSRGL
jgi:hypothetical protein